MDNEAEDNQGVEEEQIIDEANEGDTEVLEPRASTQP